MKNGRFLLAIALFSVMACSMADAKNPVGDRSQIIRVDSTNVDSTRIDSVKPDSGSVTFHKIIDDVHSQADTVGSKVGKVARQVGADGKEAWNTAKEGSKKATKAVKDFFSK